MEVLCIVHESVKPITNVIHGFNCQPYIWHHITTVSQMSHRVPLYFFHTISTLTLSHKNNIQILVSVHPHLSSSLIELIYHCAYCMPHSSLFMRWHYKRQQSREVLRTVFVCHRVPFLIPQAPAMPGGAECGGGSWCKARLRRFSCCSESGMGDGLWGSLFDSLNPGHLVMNTSCRVSLDWWLWKEISGKSL